VATSNRKKSLIIANKLRYYVARIDLFVNSIGLPFMVLWIFGLAFVYCICECNIICQIAIAGFLGLGLILSLLYFIQFGLSCISYFFIIYSKHRKNFIREGILIIVGHVFALFIIFCGIIGITQSIWMKFF
jgi:hypothetical protein